MKNTWSIIARTTLSAAILAGLLLALPGTGKAFTPTQINSCTTINSHGSYELVADLTSSGTCITITASHVDLKLNGHTITGPSGLANDGTVGIQVVGVDHVDIEGPGVIRNFGSGIDFDLVDLSEVKGVTATGNFFGFTVRLRSEGGVIDFPEKNWFRENTATGNTQHGFNVTNSLNNNFMNNTASNNGVTGIFLFNGTLNNVRGNTTNGNGVAGISIEGGGAGNIIRDNTANENAQYGIRLANLVDPNNPGSTVKGNTALNNLVFDLFDNDATCGNNLWSSNIFNTANQTCIQ